MKIDEIIKNQDVKNMLSHDKDLKLYKIDFRFNLLDKDNSLKLVVCTDTYIVGHNEDNAKRLLELLLPMILLRKNIDISNVPTRLWTVSVKKIEVIEVDDYESEAKA